MTRQRIAARELRLWAYTKVAQYPEGKRGVDWKPDFPWEKAA